MLHLLKKVRALGPLMHSRAFTVSMLSLVMAVVILQVTSMTKAVYTVDNNERTIEFMTRSDFSSLTGDGSSISANGGENASGYFVQRNIENTLQVTIAVDGVVTPYEAPRGMSVGELLYQNNVRYDGNDLLTPAAEKPLSNGDKIVVERVEYERYTVDEPIAFETVHKNSSLIKVGGTRTLQNGSDGLRTLSYVRRTVDGIKEDVQLLGEHVTRPPSKEIILLGSLAPVSKLDFDLNVDENGRPVQYARLLTEQVATGYSAREGARTASGRYALTGHVAVDPRDIPYGSELYIVSTDNKFVYGCAIAADTGTGLLADVVDVDLFYDTYQESVLNGRRIVDIYVLE